MEASQDSDASEFNLFNIAAKKRAESQLAEQMLVKHKFRITFLTHSRQTDLVSDRCS